MATGTPISVRIGDTVLTARLRDVPASRDVGYSAPSNDLVLYYGDVGCCPGIVRLGRFDGLGRAAAQSLLDEGHDVVVHARSTARLADARDLLDR